MLKPHVGRPQVYAALLLLLFLAQGLWLIENKPADPRDYSTLDCGRALLHIYDQGTCQRNDSALAASAAAAPFYVFRYVNNGPGASESTERARVSEFSEWDLFRFASWTRTAARLPFLLFGVWLGGGLWWVAKRLFGTAGGVVALALYCTSPYVLTAASTISPEIIAAWGFFGAIYTAIGIGHTIIAPVREWRFRILLLGIALGFTTAAVPLAGAVALLFCAFFLLYLAQERRMQAIAVLLGAALFACISALLLARDRWQLLVSGAPAFSFSWIGRFFSETSNIPLFALAAISLATFLGWKRTRYFGNWTPLLVAAIVPFIAIRWSALEPLAWELPFLFVFIGGIFADLFETSLRRPAAVVAVLLIAANAVLGWTALRHAVELLNVVGGR